MEAAHSPVRRLLSQSWQSQMCFALSYVSGSFSLSQRDFGSPHSAETAP